MTQEKGPHRAIAAARAVDVPLVLAGVIQPGQQAFFDREIAPHIDGERVRFVGEVGGAAKRSLFAHARGLLMPIRWDEPFGMVMVEALACGTPVIAFPEGAARELVVDGKTGFLVDDERAMAAAIGQLPRIDARDCRDWVAEHCDVDVVAAAYERTYRSVALPRRHGARACLSGPSASWTEARSSSATGCGDVRAGEGRDHGFFSEDTRFMSRWVLRVGDAPLELLSLHQSAHFDAQFVLTPTVGPDDQAPCSIVRQRARRPRLDGGGHGDQPPPRDEPPSRRCWRSTPISPTCSRSRTA